MSRVTLKVTERVVQREVQVIVSVCECEVEGQMRKPIRRTTLCGMCLTMRQSVKETTVTYRGKLGCTWGRFVGQESDARLLAALITINKPVDHLQC